MSKTEEQAFPLSNPYYTGMTLRDFFASQASVGITGSHRFDAAEIAKRSYQVADAMLAERER